MFIAQRKNGEKISLAERWDRKVLDEYRRKETFYCPICNEAVTLKLGSKRIWHFSHQKEAKCLQGYENIALLIWNLMFFKPCFCFSA